MTLELAAIAAALIGLVTIGRRELPADETGRGPLTRAPRWMVPGAAVRLKLTPELKRFGVTGMGGARLIAGKTGPGVIERTDTGELVARFTSGVLPLDATSWDLVVEDKVTERRTVSPCEADDDEPSGPTYEAWRCGDACRTWDEISTALYHESVAASARGDYSVRRTPGVIRRIMAEEKRRAWKQARSECRGPELDDDATSSSEPDWRAEPYRIGCCERWRVRDPDGAIVVRNLRTESEARSFIDERYSAFGAPF